jgi:urease accessory protein
VVAAGDCVRHAVALENGASVTLTTQAAERIYRSQDGDASQIGVSIRLGEGTSLAWLPQETILYASSNLMRRFEIDMDGSASLFMVEIIVFGRKEMGEAVRRGRYVDRWRIRRDGKLVFAESICFEGDLHAALKRAAIGNGARVIGTLLHVSSTAGDRLRTVRESLRAASSRIAASTWNGLLCVRCLGTDLEGVRRDVAGALCALRDKPMPRVWYT